MKHEVEEVVLKNGARGLLVDVPGANVMDFTFHFRAGSCYTESKELYETAHIMEHMSYGANSKFKSAQEYEAEFTKNGAFHNAYTSHVSMAYVSTCADFEWDRILDLQRLAICEPNFNEVELNSERGNVKGELTGYLNDHNRLLWPKISQLIGYDILTYPQRLEFLNSVKLKHIKEHYRKTHTSSNLRFVVAGKLHGRKATIKRQLESWDLRKGELLDIPRYGLKSAGPTTIRRKDAFNLNFGLSILIPRIMTQEESYAMGCLNHILTGTMHSKIFGKARKLGLAYNMFSSASSDHYDASWDFGGQVNYETADALFDIIKEELTAVSEGKITDEDMAAAKSYALGRYQMSAQTVSQIGGFYEGRYFTDGRVKDYTKVPKLIASTSKERIVKIVQEFIGGDIWSLAAVTNRDKAELKVLNTKVEQVFDFYKK